MLLPKHILLCLFSCLFFAANAQKGTKIPAGVIALFDDLPVDDPAKNSILHPGEDAARKISDNIFVTAAVSKKHCYLGEPILLTYTLYSALQSSSKMDRLPSLEGFGTETVNLRNESVIRKKQNGKNYRVFTLQQLQLTPLQEGITQIEPISILNEVKYAGTSGREASYSGTVKSAPLFISVDALPVAGRPAEFSGAVGRFAIAASADTLVAAGENNRLQIEINGTGNFKSVTIPAVNWPPGCQHFVSDEISVAMEPAAFPPTGKILTHINFVASKEGPLQLPRLRIDFFNPQTAKYEIAYSKPVNVKVLPPLVKSKPIEPVVAEPAKPFPLLYEILGWISFAAVVVFVLFMVIKKRKQTDIN